MNKFSDNNLIMSFTNNAYNDIINTIGHIPAESGGLLFGYLDDYVVREFVFDEQAHTTSASYTINIDFMNKHIKELWETKQLACIGFIHSHPWGLKTPSGMDVVYFRDAFNWMPREKLLVPIVSTIPDGGFNLNPCFMFPKDRKFTQGTGINIIIEPHVSKYAELINPPHVVSSVDNSSTIQTSTVNYVEGGDSINPTNLIDYYNITENIAEKSKSYFKQFLNYILDGLFPNKWCGWY